MASGRRRLGEVFEGSSGKRMILTSIYPGTALRGCDQLCVWTHIPEGETEEGLGRTYEPAWVALEALPAEVLGPDGKPR